MAALTLKAGDRAFFDCFTGLVPCRVLSITGKTGPASTAQNVHFKVTKDMGAYHTGEVMESFGLHVVPRQALIKRQYSTTIGYYEVEAGNAR